MLERMIYVKRSRANHQEEPHTSKIYQNWWILSSENQKGANQKGPKEPDSLMKAVLRQL